MHKLGNLTISEDIGLPMIVATIPRWSSFSKPWLSGHTWVSMDMKCVNPEHIPNIVSGPAASGSRKGARTLQNRYQYVMYRVGKISFLPDRMYSGQVGGRESGK